MMQLRLSNRFRPAVFLVMAALVFSIELLVTRSALFSLHPVGLSLAVLFDLVFVITALFYWLIARPFRMPISRVGLVALLMVRVALFILPETAFLPAQLWPLLLGTVEGTVLVIAGIRIRTIVRTYQKLRPSTDAETALRLSLAQIFGERAASFLIGEGQIGYYALIGWRLQADIPHEDQRLTTHRESGQITLTVALIFVGLTEAVSIHWLVMRWQPTVAVWLTISSIYGLLFFVADGVATLKRPSYLTASHLHIRLGIRWRASISLNELASVSFINEKPAKQSGLLNGSFLTAPNVLLTFTKPVTFQGPYGIQRVVGSFSFFVDDRKRLKQRIDEQVYRK